MWLLHLVRLYRHARRTSCHQSRPNRYKNGLSSWRRSSLSNCIFTNRVSDAAHPHSRPEVAILALSISLKKGFNCIRVHIGIPKAFLPTCLVINFINCHKVCKVCWKAKQLHQPWCSRSTADWPGGWSQHRQSWRWWCARRRPCCIADIPRVAWSQKMESH